VIKKIRGFWCKKRAKYPPPIQDVAYSKSELYAQIKYFIVTFKKMLPGAFNRKNSLICLKLIHLCVIINDQSEH
jgi:hypothetical protein